MTNTCVCQNKNKQKRVLESLKAGRRLPEARFGNLKVASKGQPSVYRVFSKK